MSPKANARSERISYDSKDVVWYVYHSTCL